MNRKQNDLWTGRYYSLLFSTFIAYVGFQMLVPTLTAQVRQTGEDNLSASLVYSAAAIAALSSRSIFGSMMDRIGRQPVLLTGGTVLVATDLLLFTVSSVPLICVIRFCQGLGWGMVSTALATIASDLVPARRIGEGIGYFALSVVFATSLSVVFGIWLMNLSGFFVMLGCSTVLFAAAVLLCLYLGSVPFIRHPAEEPAQSLLARLFEPRALLPATLCFLHSVAFSGVITFIMLFGIESGISNVFVFFLGHVLMIVVSRPLVGRIFDRKGHTVIVIPGVLSMVVGFILLSYSHTNSLLFVSSLFYGLGFGMVQPSLQAWAIDRSPTSRKGVANGTFLSSLDLGYAGGAILTGAVASATSYAVMYRLSPILLAAFLVIYIVALKREKSELKSG